MFEQLRVGVIGAGNMGRHHLRNYHELPEADLVAVADPSDESKKLAERYEAQHYSDYRTMLDDARLTAVSIAVPTPLHYPFARETLERGIHTLIEKPIAGNEAEAAELIELSKEKNLIFTVGHIERYNRVIRELKAIMDSGQLGQVSSIIAQRIGGFPRIEPETDVVVDLAIHDIDIISYLTGHKPEILAAHGTNTFHQSEKDSAEILLRYGDASGFVQANWVSPVKIRQITVTGSKGYVTANYITQEISLYEHMAIRTQENFEAFVRLLGEPEEKKISFQKTEPLRKELRAFIMAASGVLEPELLVSPEEAVTALKTALEIARRLREDGFASG